MSQDKTVSKNKSDEQKMLVTADTNLGEIVQEHPEVAEVLLDWGLHCVGCGASHFDTIEMGAKLHGYNDSEIADLVSRVNEVIQFKE